MTSAKKCTRCGESKGIEAFSRHTRAKDGLDCWCRECKADYAKTHPRDSKKDKVNAVKYMRSHRDAIRQRSVRFRSTRPHYHRQYRDSHREAYRSYVRRWQELNPHKYKVQCIAKSAKKCGILTSPGRCQICGTPSGVEMHHCDYSKPLIVEWLCRKCHARIHRCVAELLALVA